MDCPFCDRAGSGQLVAQNGLAVAFPDAFPVSRGHTLILPRRHSADLFSVSSEELASLWELTLEATRLLKDEHAPNGFNIGANVGEAAGQTIAHAHIHVIPRYRGDVVDPRGGIRWVIKEKAAYWEK